MKIGYPCINRSVGCTANRTFRLASYSDKKMREIVSHNLDCLQMTLEFNVKNNLFFFRIGSGFIPFASHPICTFDWKQEFKSEFQSIGRYIHKHNFRISMHPDQFVLINALNEKIIENSISELLYHSELLDQFELDETAKMQIHVGGVYGDKEAAIERFIESYKKLPQQITKRLVVENDDNRFSVKDCLEIHQEVSVPIVFDTLHHECLNKGESMQNALTSCLKTWKKKDGLPFIDYSTQDKEKRKGAHTFHIDIEHFKTFIKSVGTLDFDIMLEIKDKELSALEAIQFIKSSSSL
jgi:UV DNA damage endonuclease